MAKLPDMKPRYYLVTVDDDPRRCRLLDADGNELPMVANAEWRSGGTGEVGRTTVELMFVALGPPPVAADEEIAALGYEHGPTSPAGVRRTPGAIPAGLALDDTNLSALDFGQHSF